MASGRFISTSVATDVALASLSIEAEALYLRTIPHLDRDGLITGEPLVLLGHVAPLRIPTLHNRMAAIIGEWIEAGLVVCYPGERTPVLWFSGFQRNQRLRYDREAPSVYPPPPGYHRTADGLEPIPATPAAPAEPTPELLRTNSRATPPYITDNRQHITDNRRTTATATASPHPRASRPGNKAAAAPQGKPEIREALAGFGVTEPALSRLASNGVTLDDVEAWITAISDMPNLTSPAAFLVKRLTAHDPPPAPPPPPEDPDSYEALYRRYVPPGYEDVIEH